MTVEKKIELLEDLFEMEAGELSPETELSSIDEWDSMTKLSLIVLMEDECDKTISREDIKQLVTVQDIMNLMD